VSFLHHITPRSGSRGTAIAALTAAGILWGLTVPLSKLALDWLGPAWLTVGRFAVAAPLLAIVARRRLRSAITPTVGAWGALGCGAVVLVQNAGIERTSVSHAALIVGVAPVLVAGITAAAGRGASGPVAWLGFALALSGVGLVAKGGGGSAAAGGDALVLLSVTLSAVAISVQPRLLAGRDPIAVTAVQLGAGALLALPAALAREGLPPAPPASGWALPAALLVSSAGTLLPFALFAYGQARVSPELAGAFMNLEPLVGAMAGAAAFGDKFGPAQLAGGLVLVAGITLSALPRREGERAAEPRAGGPACARRPTTPNLDRGDRQRHDQPRLRAGAGQPGHRRVRIRRERPPNSRTAGSGARAAGASGVGRGRLEPPTSGLRRTTGCASSSQMAPSRRPHPAPPHGEAPHGRLEAGRRSRASSDSSQAHRNAGQRLVAVAAHELKP